VTTIKGPGLASLRAIVLMAIPLAGCGPSGNVPPKIAERADVIVTLDGGRHACSVALYNEAHGSSVACTEVVPFLRDELRLPSGSIYDLRTISNVDEAEISRVAANLQGAGYRFIGGRRIASLAEQHKGG
jgi:hypothetical protein